MTDVSEQYQMPYAPQDGMYGFGDLDVDADGPVRARSFTPVDDATNCDLDRDGVFARNDGHPVLFISAPATLVAEEHPLEFISIPPLEGEPVEADERILAMTCSASTSSIGSTNSYKRSSSDSMESITSTKRVRGDTVDSTDEDLTGAFASQAAISPKVDQQKVVSALWEKFNPKSVLHTTRNAQIAMRVFAEVTALLPELRRKSDQRPLDGKLRRDHKNVCDYLALLSWWLRQDCVSTIDAEELDISNMSSFYAKHNLSFAKRNPELPDILAGNVLYRNGKKLMNSLYGYVALYERIETSPNGDKPKRKEKVAIKVYLKKLVVAHETSCGQSVQEDPIRELKFQEALTKNDLPHKRILHLQAVLESRDKLFAVFPYIAGDLFRYVSNRDEGMPENEVKSMFRKMVEAVAYCHSQGICHRDVSLENFLIRFQLYKDEYNNDMAVPVPVLIDFGLCAVMEPAKSNKLGRRWALIKHTGSVGKTGYMAPEVYNHDGKEYYDGIASDIWSLGVCLFSMLFRCPPWKTPARTDRHYDYLVANKGVREWIRMYGSKTISDEVIDLLQAIFQQDPAKRITLEGILAHPWLRRTPYAPFSPCEDDSS